MISDFFEGRGFDLQQSESEARRFGFSVVRATVPLNDTVSDEDVAVAVQAARSELVIVRFDERRKELGRLLQEIGDAECIHADTLVYYVWNLHRLVRPTPRPSSPKISQSTSFADVVGVLRESFKDYRNHYSANPRLATSVTVAAYEDWAKGLMQSDTSRAFVARQPSNGEVVGFVLLTLAQDERLAEVALNAVHPNAQRGGVYSALMLAAAEYLVTLGSVERLFISTQRENQAVIAAWQKLGLEPFLTLETYHVMRRIGA
ncbi:MAG: GNAT family N-acetyltransferase [Actinomycetota bacterium]